MKKSDQTSIADSIGKVAECTGCGHKLTDEEIAAYVELAVSGSYSRRAANKETVHDIPLPSGGSITLRVPTAESLGTLSGGEYSSKSGIFRSMMAKSLAKEDQETAELKTKGFSRLFKLPSGEKIVLSGLTINKLSELHAMKMDAASWQNEQLKKLGLGDHATPQDAVDASAMLTFLSTQPGRTSRFPVSFTDSKGVTVTSPEPGVLQPDIVVNDSPAFRRELFPLGSGPMFNVCSPQREQMFAETEVGKWLGQAFKNDNPVHALAGADIALPKGGRGGLRFARTHEGKSIFAAALAIAEARGSSMLGAMQAAAKTKNEPQILAQGPVMVMSTDGTRRMVTVEELIKQTLSGQLVIAGVDPKRVMDSLADYRFTGLNAPYYDAMVAFHKSASKAGRKLGKKARKK